MNFVKSILYTVGITLGLAPAVARATVFVYSASLSGLNESPANASPAIGLATVTYNDSAHTLRVQVSFSGLLGTTTASHIHAPTVSAGVSTAGVATTTPTFAGFPSGVTSGSYDNTLDLTLASSYNPAFVTANGGTTATAEAALIPAIGADKAYLNIHTTVFPGGEIRGFLTPPVASVVLLDTANSLVAGDLLQTNRVTRSGAPSDWTTNKIYPGTTTVASGLHYHTYTVPAATIGGATNIHISITSGISLLFVAYEDAYLPTGSANSLSTNYLGDPGASGNVGCGILMPANHDLVIALSETATNAGLGVPVHLVAEGFLVPPVPYITSSSISGVNLTLGMSNVLGGRLYNVIASTNVSLVATQWSTAASFAMSTTLGADRSSTVTNAVVNTNSPRQLYRLQYK